MSSLLQVRTQVYPTPLAGSQSSSSSERIVSYDRFHDRRLRGVHAECWRINQSSFAGTRSCATEAGNGNVERKERRVTEVQDGSSWVFIVGVPIEQVLDNLQHRYQKALLVTLYSSEEAKSLIVCHLLLLRLYHLLPPHRLHLPLSFLHHPMPVLPWVLFLVPVVHLKAYIRIVAKRRLERRIDLGGC
jgi:hypothetical protein